MKKRMGRVALICVGCGAGFSRTFSYATAKPSRGQYCSRQCSDEAHIREGNPGWKGGRRLVASGQYVEILQDDGNRKLEHIAIAEKALGKPLPVGAIVHHHDQAKTHNVNDNLVICQDRGYHAHIHKRMRIMAQWFDPDTHTSCPTCQQIKLKTEFHKNKNSYTGLNNECKPCVLIKSAKRYERRKLTIEEI